ncbi:uncharacterized protein LOC124267751 isoform X2 [Haliotis rubra]|nr:uncharacterized protein LOC124267751 isoform X2 [Haliotis rubra]
MSTDMSAKKLPNEGVLRDASEEVLIATSNPFRPPVYATGCFWKKMSERLKNDIILLPEGSGERWNTETQTLLGASKMGLIYMGTSLAQMLDLQLKDTNIEGVLDACVIASDQPVQILTFVRSDSKDNYHTLIQRNDELSKGVLYSLREFTDETFNIVHGVLDLDDLGDIAGFEDKRSTLMEESCRYVNPRSLEMNPSKCKNLCKAFFVASAVEHTSTRTSSDPIVLLKWDVYMKKYLHEPKVNENHAANETEIAHAEDSMAKLSNSVTTTRGVKKTRKTFCRMFAKRYQSSTNEESIHSS